MAAAGTVAALAVAICLPRFALGQELHRVEIVDAGGFAQPMIAASVELPGQVQGTQQCWGSYSAALRAIRMGYTNVHW